MQRIDQNALIDLLSKDPTNNEIIIKTVTTVPMVQNYRKTGGFNPYCDQVTKHSKIRGEINWRYEEAVNEQREKEGIVSNFRSEERPWGEHIEGTPWIYHKGKYYLNIKIIEVIDEKYIYAGQEEIDLEEIEDVMRKRPSVSHRQFLKNEVRIKDIKIENIAGLIFGDEEYILSDKVFV